MGGKKRNQKPSQKVQNHPPVQPEEGKRFVNLLHVYTIYKQKFRRLSKEQYEELLCDASKGKIAAIELCKEFMKAKQITDDVSFEKNVGFLSVPRLLPLIALLAERSGYNIKPSVVILVNFIKTPQRFQEKFAQLLVYGFWYLGRVISDSLSVKDQVNRGNMFNFSKGDLGFWWAGVRILDWNYYVYRESKDLNKKALRKKRRNLLNCHSFVIQDPPNYRFNTNSAIGNMHQHPMYFLSETDWKNFTDTVKSVRHKCVFEPPPPVKLPVLSPDCSEEEDDDDEYDLCTEDDEDFSYSYDDPDDSDVSSFSSEFSVNTLASRESID